eukprot:NODE_10828_length_1326_cov_2.474562.p1 GENE.NODE_10828_length_1326_cov_2.474562~~NODE_10828_length_1326_cov_2.474562.p1  ORF type:complete len:338 (-),score=123.41 NODE_10828_length_1326_cov_2.474562:312-1325(-)
MVAAEPPGAAAARTVLSALGSPDVLASRPAKPALPVSPTAPVADPSGTAAALRPPAWAGRMTLTRSFAKQLNVHATLLHGQVQLVELCLRIAAGSGGLLNISHRVPFDDLARRTPGAIFSFLPMVVPEQAQYEEYMSYFRAKARAGVARLNEVDALYIVPPAKEAEPLLTKLQAASGVAMPKDRLIGVVAATPGPAALNASLAVPATPRASATMAQPVAPPRPPAAASAALAPAPAAPATAVAAADVARAAAATEANAATPAPTQQEATEGDAATARQGPAAVAAAAADGSDGKARRAAADADNQSEEMSSEALLDLFSNPELIRSLQSADAAAATE